MKTESLKTDSLLNIDEIVNNYTKSYAKKEDTDELNVWSEPLIDDHIKFSEKKQNSTNKLEHKNITTPLKNTKIALTSSLELMEEKTKKSTNNLKLTQVFSDFSFDDLLTDDDKSEKVSIDKTKKIERAATLEFNLPTKTELLNVQNNQKVNKTKSLKTSQFLTEKLSDTNQAHNEQRKDKTFKTEFLNSDNQLCDEDKKLTKPLKTKRQTKIIDVANIDDLDLDDSIPTKTVRFDENEQTRPMQSNKINFSKTTTINHKDYEDPFNFSDFDEIYKSMENNKPTTPIVEFTHKTVAFSDPTKAAAFSSTKSFSKIFFNDENSDLTQELDNRNSISFEPSSKCEKKRFFTTFFKRNKNNKN